MLNTLFKMVLIANMGARGFIDADMGDGDTINGDLGVDYINPVDITDEGIIDSKTLDQTDGIRTIMEAGYDYVLFPAGTYRVRNLWVQEGQTLDIRGTVKQIDISSFTVTQNAPQGQDFVYIENATSAEMDSWEALLNEAPTHYNYVCYWDDDYDTEGEAQDRLIKTGGYQD